MKTGDMMEIGGIAFKVPNPLVLGGDVALWLQRFALSPTIHTTMQVWDNAHVCYPAIKWVFFVYTGVLSAILGYPKFKADFRRLAKLEIKLRREETRKALELANTPRSPENP